MPWLSIIRAGEIAESFPVGDESVSDAPPFITIGSDPGNLFCLPEADVAPFHAIVSVDDGEITITDQGSPSGLYRNDLPIDEASLEDGDRLVIGSVELVFHSAAEYRLQASRRGSLAWIALGLVAIVAVGGGGYWFSQRGKNQDSAGADDLRLPDPAPTVATATKEDSSEPIAEPPPQISPTLQPAAEPEPAMEAPSKGPGEVAATNTLPPAPAEPELSSPADDPPVAGPVALFPQWHLDQKFRYQLEETKRTESNQGVALFKVSAEGSAQVIETPFVTRNRDTGEVKRGTANRVVVSWQKLQLERDTKGTQEVYDSDAGDNSRAGSLAVLGDPLISGSRRAGVPIRNAGRPLFLNNDGSVRFVVPTADASWDVGETTYRNPSITPARLLILPHLAWQLPHGEKSQSGARWSGSVELNLDDHAWGGFTVDADYHLEKVEGSLAVIRVVGSVDPELLRTGISVKDSEVKATLHIDVLRHVLTYYQSEIRVEAADNDGAPLRIEQHLVSRLLNRDDFSPTRGDSPDSPDSTAVPPKNTPDPPDVPQVAGLNKAMLSFQELRAAEIAKLVTNFRQALQREAASTALQSLETWIEQVRQELGQPQYRALPALPALPESPAPSARLVEVRGIFDSELTRIEQANGLILFTLLQASSIDLRKRQQPGEADAILRYANALRESKLIP